MLSNMKINKALEAIAWDAKFITKQAEAFQERIGRGTFGVDEEVIDAYSDTLISGNRRLAESWERFKKAAGKEEA